MNKRIIFLCMTIFSAIGSYLPVVLGFGGVFSGWSIIGGVVGGIFGIWLGVFISQRVE